MTLRTSINLHLCYICSDFNRGSFVFLSLRALPVVELPPAVGQLPCPIHSAPSLHWSTLGHSEGVALVIFILT